MNEYTNEQKIPEEFSSDEIEPEKMGEDTEKSIEKGDTGVDYDLLMKEDLESLKSEFPELCETASITELEDPLRYAALRDLGLTPAEAYLATAKRRIRHDTRAHLQSSVPKFASMPKGSMSEGELIAAREIFGNLSDAQIKKLYKKVTV